MSLIYSAIRSLEKKRAAEGMPDEPQASGHARQPRAGASARWLYAAGIGSVAAVVIGGTAIAMVRERSKEVTPPTVASATAPVVVQPEPEKMAAQIPVQQALPAVSELRPEASVSAPQVPPAPVSQISALVPPVPVALAEKPVSPVRAPVEPEVTEHQAQHAVFPAPAVASIPARRARPAPAAVVVESAHARPAFDDLNHLAAAAKKAIDAGNQDEAESILRQLAASLPPESVTLLRLRAWQALRNKDPSRAIELYGQIVERLPDDETASINLAVLNWKTGQHDEARRIVGTLSERRPDSETVRRYVAQFGVRR